MFSLGYSFGFWKTFSIVYSIIMFQLNTSSLLPQIIFELGHKLKGKKLKYAEYMIIGFTWLFPYFIAAIPFAKFFHPSRTQWLRDNGFHGIDYDE